MTKRMMTVCVGAITVGALAAGAQGISGTPVPASGAITVVTGAVPRTPAVIPVAAAATTTAYSAPAKVVAPISTAAAVLAADKLPPLNLKNMRLWNWNGLWHASEWANPESQIGWRYNRVAQPTGNDTFFTLDAAGAPQLQAQNGTAAAASGLWETEVTLPTLRDGMIVAPLWLYDPASKDEIDFEFAGRKGLDVTMHAYVKGVHKQSTARLFAGRDMSGQRKRFGIKVNQAAGFVEMYVDGERVYSFNRSSMSFFVSRPLKPWIEMWATNPANGNYVQWAGKWSALPKSTSVIMNVHGYRYSSLAR